MPGPDAAFAEITKAMEAHADFADCITRRIESLGLKWVRSNSIVGLPQIVFLTER